MQKKQYAENEVAVALKQVQTRGQIPNHGHWFDVKKALDAGKPVPPEVLKDYPDLQPKDRQKSESATKPVPLDWNNLHVQSREEILSGAGMQTKLATKKWSELDTWVQELLKDSLERRSKGRAKIEPATGTMELQSLKVAPNRKPLRDMTKAELKQLRVILHILPDGTLWIKEKGTDSLERQVASWNPSNRPDMTELSRIGGYISSEKIADDAKKWLDAVAKKYDLDMDEIVAETWRGGGMRHKDSPYKYLTNIVTGKVKTTSGSDTEIDKTTELQAIEDSRSTRSREADERQEHSLIVEPSDPRVETWKRDPGRIDVRGIDTPKKRKRRTAKRSRGPSKPDTSLRGVRR